MNQAQFWKLPEVVMLQDIQKTHADGSPAHKSAFEGIKTLLIMHMGLVFADEYMGEYHEPVKSEQYQTIVRIAEQFRANLRAALSGGELIEADRLNATPEYQGFCASHDFCDANVYMDEAFTTVVGRQPHLAIVQDTPSDSELWSSAWNLAKAMGFRWQLIDAVIERGGTALDYVDSLHQHLTDPEVESDPLVVLFEAFGVKDPHYVLDMQAVIKEAKGE